MSSQDVPLFPPYEFVRRLNEAVAGQWSPEKPPPPYRTALDPLVMLAWHQASTLRPLPLIISGV